MTTQDFIITGDDDETAAAEIQEHAEREGWGEVRPDWQQRVRLRGTMRDAVVQKRGAFWFAFSSWDEDRAPVVGPEPSRARAVTLAIGDLS